MSDLWRLWEGNHGVRTGGVPAAEAGGRRDPPPETEGRRLGLQAPGGRYPFHIQYLNKRTFPAISLSVTSQWTLAFFCVSDVTPLSVSENKGVIDAQIQT